MQIHLENTIYGGQTIGTLTDGRKALVWGGLPDELVEITVTKKKSKYIEGVASQIIQASPHRIAPQDPDSYLSTSPWQIFNFQFEQQQKKRLIQEAFQLHHIQLNELPNVQTDGQEYEYRNKVEFSWYSDFDERLDKDTLDLAFFRRGSKGKIVVEGTSLAKAEINQLARAIRDILRTKSISARNLKSLIVRSNQQGRCTWQLYLKDRLSDIISPEEAAVLPAQGGEVIYSDPKSPASRITERLAVFGETTLNDTLLGTSFCYPTESFFQINLPIYEQTLADIRNWTNPSTPVVDLYSGVGTIGLTVSGGPTTLVEIDRNAVKEMQRNIDRLGLNATAVLAPSEQALDHISSDCIVVVDPPRAGLHQKLIDRLLEQTPPRIIYLSCNPATQARDVSLLLDKYQIKHLQGYNFFPRTPHIENLVILDLVD